MTDEHENSQSDAPKASASPASPEGGEEKPWPSDDYENIGTAGDRDEPQTSRRPPAGHPQDRSQENGEPYQPYAESNAGTAGGAGSLRQANGGFSNRPTDVEAAYEESASRAAADGELDRRRCAQCRGSPDGKERQYQQRGAFVWLHPECRRYWLKKHPQ